MTRTARLFIDVTQLIHWSGRLTGIPRVMNELASRYADADSTVFVVWNNKTKRFYEIALDASLSDRGVQIHYVEPESGSFQRSLQAVSSTKAYGAVVKKLPGKRTARRAYGVIKRASLPKVVMQKNDILFVLWGEWGQASYIAELQTKHAEGIKLVQVAYDLLPIVTPQYSGHSTKSMDIYNTAIMPLCSLVLSISESTKRDLIQWLNSKNLTVPNIQTFRLGDDFQLSKPQKPTAKKFIKSELYGNDYILCVGTIEARKNHTLLYYVYKLAHSRGIDLPKLVIVGRRGWKSDNIYDIMTEDPVTNTRIVALTGVDDEELSWLYQNALCSIYPSFYEGWGLPIAESTLYGLPCICSNTSSIPEIAGDLVHYFNPASTDECLAALQKLLVPTELAASKKRLSNYKTTSWNDTFVQVNKYIQEL